MVLGELVPKTLAISHPERQHPGARRADVRSTARLRPGHPGVCLRPRTGSCGASAWSSRARAAPTLDRASELQFLIRSSGEVGTLRPRRRHVARRAPSASARRPRPTCSCRACRVVAIGHDQSVARPRGELSLESGHSRFPVYRRGPRRRRRRRAREVDPSGCRRPTRAHDDGDPIMTEVLAVPEARDLGRAVRRLPERRQLPRGGRRRARRHRGDHHARGRLSRSSSARSPTSTTRRRRRSPRSTRGGCVRAARPPAPRRGARGAAVSTCRRATTRPWPASCSTGWATSRSRASGSQHDGWQIEVVAIERLRIATVRLVQPRADADRTGTAPMTHAGRSSRRSCSFSESTPGSSRSSSRLVAFAPQRPRGTDDGATPRPAAVAGRAWRWPPMRRPSAPLAGSAARHHRRVARPRRARRARGRGPRRAVGGGDRRPAGRGVVHERLVRRRARDRRVPATWCSARWCPKALALAGPERSAAGARPGATTSTWRLPTGHLEPRPAVQRGHRASCGCIRHDELGAAHGRSSSRRCSTRHAMRACSRSSSTRCSRGALDFRVPGRVLGDGAARARRLRQPAHDASGRSNGSRTAAATRGSRSSEPGSTTSSGSCT